MIKNTSTLFLVFLFVGNLAAQKHKPTPTFKDINVATPTLDVNPQPNLKARSTGHEFDIKKVKQIEAALINRTKQPFKFIEHPDQNRVLKVYGNLPIQDWASIEEQADAYVEELINIRSGNPEIGLKITQKNSSETGTHLRTIQTFKGFPILGTEGVLHAKDNIIYSYTGDLVSKITLNTTAELSLASALDKAKVNLALEGINWQEIPESDYFLLENKERFSGELKILALEKDQSKLVWDLTIYASMHERWKFVIDAHSGEVINSHPAFCKLWHHPDHGHCSASLEEEKAIHSKESSALLPPGTANAQDLFNINRTINIYQEGGTFFLIDASRNMFNPSLSQFPNDGQGVIWTLDANNTNPQNNDFDYTHITSGSNVWNNQNAVSAHYNGGKAYEYFEQTHSRNSINGQGGNIISLIRVSDQNGDDFDNAFWNGAAMFYGNGDQAFNASLAKGLDVAGHEMSHGVIQATANLVYQNQPGALNESFADIFGAMIDRDDWGIGEDVANPSVFPTGKMRDMADPNNGGNSTDFYWQPKHMNEFKNLPNTQQGDWGGVHINSGIPNHAYYLFATSVGKSDAEKVYYEVLANHLTANSEFIDLRLAVVEVANQLLGASGKTAAENAFDGVGIMDGQGNDFQNDVNENPGDDIILWSDLNQIGLTNLSDMSTDVISNLDHITRPSISDDGSYIVYVDDQNRLIQIDVDWNNQTLQENFLENNPQTIWRNVAVSKDATKLAILTTQQDNQLLIFDRVSGASQTFDLVNPTTAQGVTTGDVQYADVLEWDLTGESVMYDAFNELQTNSFEDISYWDIGIIKVWNNSISSFELGQIIKLFNGLQENESVGNPTFSKNSPYIIAFDYIQSDQFGSNEYSILGANIETGDIGEIWANSKLGYPSYSVEDDKVLFAAENNASEPLLGTRDVAADKITGINNAEGLIAGPSWGHWFANGTRDLVSVNQFSKGKVVLFPNPAESYLQLNLRDFDAGRYAINLVNLLGQRTLVKEFDLFGSEIQEQIDLFPFASGAYFLEIRRDDGSFWVEPIQIK